MESRFDKIYFYIWVTSLFLICIAAVIGICALAHADAPKKIVFIGDSITAGHNVGDTEAFSYLVGYAFGNVTIKNMASGGEDTNQSRSKMPGVWAENPYILVIMYGLNDACRNADNSFRVPIYDYGVNLSDWIRGAQYRGIKVILMTSTPNTPLRPESNLDLRPYTEKVMELARTRNVPLLDEYGRFDKEFAEGITPAYLLPDGVHINNYGHALISLDLVTLIRQQGWN